MASPNLSDLVTTTLRNRSGQLADNVTKNNEIIRRLNARGNVKPARGGRVIVQEVEYAENSGYKRYSGYEPLDISPQELFSAFEFDWKQVALPISISGLEQLMNTGKDAIIDLLESRINNGEKSMMNGLAADCYSDGTADSGKQVGGLQLLVADAPTSGTVGGVNRATWTFARNQVWSGVTDGGAAVSATNIQSYMNRLWLKCKRGNDVTDLIVSDDAYFNLYWQSLQAIQRIQSVSEGQAGYQMLKFMGADVVADGGQGGNCPANHMYFLNTGYLFLRPHPDRNMTQIGGERASVNQDATIRLIGWAGNMTSSNMKLQGVLKA